MPLKPRRSTWPRWLAFLREHSREQGVALLLRYLIVLGLSVLAFSAAFHVVMALEGQGHPWWVGVYWTVSTMTTLGLGDVVFTSPAGEALTAIVVLSGILFMLVFLPLVLIQFSPWIERRTAARLWRRLPEARGHVLITRYDPVVDLVLRETTGCSVVAVMEGDDVRVAPGPTEVLPSGADLLLIGSRDSERRFLLALE